MTDPLEGWVAALAAELDVDPAAVDRELLLEVSRAAHGVARAAGPITILLVGLAAGRDGGGAEAVARALGTTRGLAVAHTPAGE